MSKTFTYNLPGYGSINYQIFPYTKKIYDFLNNDEYNHIQRLKNIDQLGALRNTFPGAHHNRYEYVIAQFSIITELCYLEGPQPFGINLSSPNNKGIKKIPEIVNDPPSTGDILQSLVLLSNIGHLPNTFADERALLNFFKNNREPKYKFKQGLITKISKNKFEKMLQRFDIYNFHYFLALFMINRYKRLKQGKMIVNLCQKILNSYFEFLYEDGIQQNNWNIYNSIRRLTIISLDSLYTPVPFSLDLNSIFLSLEKYIEKYFRIQSEFQDALRKLEELLTDTVYLNPKALLNLSRCSDKTLNLLQNHIKKNKLDTITKIKQILVPKNKYNLFSQNINSQNLTKYISIGYQLKSNIIQEFSNKRIDWERKAQNQVGKSYSQFAMEWDPSYELLRITGGMTKKVPNNKKLDVTLKIAKKIGQASLRLNKKINNPKTKWENGKNFLRFLLSSFFGEEKLYRFKAFPVVNESPIYINKGSTKISNNIDKFYEKIEIQENIFDLDEDELNEIKMVIKTLKKINYQGLIISYIGSTEIVNNEALAEFDGIIFMLGQSKKSNPFIIVEAKNTYNGHTQAKNDLKSKMKNLEIDDKNYNINFLGDKGAYALIKSTASIYF